MAICYFSSDLHGRVDQYEKLFDAILAEPPEAVFLGGDLLPSGLAVLSSRGDEADDFVAGFLVPRLRELKRRLSGAYPRMFVILGNDDPRSEESAFEAAAADGVWTYIHDHRADLGDFVVYGYAFVPPTPFLLKDWERYDVSQFVDPGCVSPEEGHRTVPVAPRAVRYATIQADLDRLTGDAELTRAIMLFHAPPYQSKLDRIAMPAGMIDHAPVDVHVGSVAIQRFIAARQPLLTLHGHIHESARLTGAWQDRIGKTVCLSAAHDGPELALVRFDPANPAAATRSLI